MFLAEGWLLTHHNMCQCMCTFRFQRFLMVYRRVVKPTARNLELLIAQPETHPATHASERQHQMSQPKRQKTELTNLWKIKATRGKKQIYVHSLQQSQRCCSVACAFLFSPFGEEKRRVTSTRLKSLFEYGKEEMPGTKQCYTRAHNQVN